MSATRTPWLLCLLFLVSAKAQDNSDCILGDIVEEQDFPNIDSLGYESYQMTVEYTLAGVQQTDYYVEYYDTLNGKGRIEGHQMGDILTYIYWTDTWEAWNIRGQKCTLTNVTEPPDMFRSFQTNWVYEVEGDPSKRTIGPSAMFKNAWARWNHKDLKRTMAFMGELPHSHVRGLKARVWRWCQSPNTSVDYYFTTADTDNAYKVKTLPLRVEFNGAREGEDLKLTVQSYDIINFQPYISYGIYPFQLPKGLGCTRDENAEKPDLPIVEAGSPVLFWAEVVYRKVKISKQEDLGSWYSRIMMAVDPLYGNVAFGTAPWNSTEVKGKDGEKDHREYFQDSPYYLIHDLEQGYGYKINRETGECTIGRGQEFAPVYRLPDNGGDLDLRNPFIFFATSEYSYLTKGFERGLEVQIFEAISNGYVLNMKEQATKVIASHTYFANEIVTDNEVTMKNAPVQTEMHIFRDPTSDLEEILTVNFYGYTTKFTNRRKRIFDISRCFKNDDDYSWVTIGYSFTGDMSNFDVDPTQVEQNFLSELLELDSIPLNPTRVPTILVDVQDNVIVTFKLLEKPLINLDYTEPETDMTIDSSETLGLMTLEQCAATCLDSYDCWGFSLCGSTCVLGGKNKTETVKKELCYLYRRFNNNTYMKPKSAIVNTLKAEVNSNQGLKLTVVNSKTDKEVDLKAVFLYENNPAEQEEIFNKMGNIVSNRMKVLKTGFKLKNGKSLGKLRFDECQRLCLDYQDCETLSYCLLDSVCIISPKYGEEIKDVDLEKNSFCELVSRTYTDHFDVDPGYFMKVTASKSIKVADSEACARACIKETGFKCLSVDMCAGDPSGNNCFLHTSHFLKKSTRKDELGTKASCIHHSKKYSVEFQKHIQTRVKGTTVPELTNLDVEECAKQCVDYGQGSCYGFDFCRGDASDSSTCIIINSDPSRLENTFSSACTQYLRDGSAYAPRPYTNSYAAGIGFLCFVIGGVVGAVIVFVIAYIRVNKQ